jgi:putative peptide zinc metalloprotease protein
MDEFKNPRANPFLEASAFDSNAGQPMVLCVVPSAGENVRFAVPEKYLQLIQAFDGKRTEEEAIAKFKDANPDQFETEWLRRLVRQSLIPKGLIVHPEQDASTAGVSSQPSRGFLFIKLPIFPPAVVDPIAKVFSFMFLKPFMTIGLLLFVASHLYVYGVLLQHETVNIDTLDAGSILLIMLFSTLATICHEFGHASAAAHYGCKRISIGWGVYIVYTVLWTNVSEAWKLPRHQRAVVDVGGVYFESLALLALLAAYLQTGNPVFLFAFVFIDFSILTTLNPFLRMDGYWLFSDLFGIVNLRQQQTIWLQDIAVKIFGDGEHRENNNLTKTAKRALAVYSVLGVAFFVYLLFVLFDIVVLDIASGFPARLSSFAQDIRAGLPLIDIAGSALEIFWRGLMLVGASYTIFSLVQRVSRFLAQLVQLRRGAMQPSAN